MVIPETKPLDQWNLNFTDPTPKEGEKPELSRHEGAKRCTKPAWMTKGMGVGKEMFGEPTGMMKPGDNKKPDAAKDDGKPEYDPMGDVYRSVVKDAKIPSRA